MTHRPLVRVFMNGGIVAPADLLRVLDASEQAGNAHVHFSARQDILIPVSGEGVRAAAAVLREGALPFAPTSLARLHDPWARRNIVSSYAAVNVTATTWWLTEDVYEYTLAAFDEQPRIPVHLVDPRQGLVPLFGGHVHFVASSREHYWHLYIRGGDQPDRVVRRSGLFHGDDLPGVARSLEDAWLAEPRMAAGELMERIPTDSCVDDGDAAPEPPLSDGRFPYYEGFNSMSNHQLWLGLYWRNNRFDIPFLRAACELCRDTRIGKISLTPWKSFLIKGIRLDDRNRWDELMGAHGINTRHSSLELNWHIPVLDDDALELKNEIVRELTMRDISTYGLTFTIRSSERTPPFTTVLVERGVSAGAETYSIRHTPDFAAGGQEYVDFAEGVSREAIPSWLVDLSKLYWRRGASASAPGQVSSPQEATTSPAAGAADPEAVPSGHRCPVCMTVYDERYGDRVAGVEPGVAFEALPPGYACSVCSTGRELFEPVALS